MYLFFIIFASFFFYHFILYFLFFFFFSSRRRHTRLTCDWSSDVCSSDLNKGLYGHVLIAAGGRGKSGAPAMTSLAALRTGAGLVTAAVPQSILPSVAAITPELMTLPLEEGAHGEIDASNLEPDKLKALLARATVIAMGPGMGTEPEAFVLGLIEKTKLPLVID